MNVCIRLGLGTALGLVLGVFAGCDYSPPPSYNKPTGTYRDNFAGLGARKTTGGAAVGSKDGATGSGGAEREMLERSAILDSSITLIQRASLQPGGQNFQLAIQKLNQYFEGASPGDYQLEPAAQEFLASQFSSDALRNLHNQTWELRDARHVEDCMMYYSIANRVAGAGDDLTRVGRLFDWLVRQIQLVPAESLGAPQLRQAYARPYDVLMRGVATEAGGYWAERSWAFMALCRQLGVDSGLIVYSKGNRIEPPAQKVGFYPDLTAKLLGAQVGESPAIIWICGVLIDGRIYLFDARVGRPVPGPGGKGIATLDQAMSDTSILEAMNLPGESPYGTSRATLLSSPSKIGVLLDSSLSLYSPKMKMLQRQLAGKNRTILYRDVVDERDQFTRALGDQAGKIGMWMLPIEVETRLFTDGDFVRSTQLSLLFFRLEFPLVYARVKQLRGDLDDAIKEYVDLRLKENATFATDKKTPIPQQIQDGLDVYGSYYLALAQLEKNDAANAEKRFLKLLEILPAPSPSEPYYNMFRWGANANLGRIYEAKGDYSRAIAYYSQSDPTSQRHGNLLAARDLALRDPTADKTVTLPPPPKARSRSEQAAGAATAPATNPETTAPETAPAAAPATNPDPASTPPAEVKTP